MTNENEAFEKFISELDFQDIAHDTESIRNLYKRAWFAAKADSVELHTTAQEYATQNTILVAKNENLEREIAELKAHINDLREALERINHAAKGIAMSYIHTQCKEALAKTPAQSLQAHDDEVIEKCARAAEPEDSYQDDWFKAKVRASEQIRALKGKQNDN